MNHITTIWQGHYAFNSSKFVAYDSWITFKSSVFEDWITLVLVIYSSSTKLVVPSIGSGFPCNEHILVCMDAFLWQEKVVKQLYYIMLLRRLQSIKSWHNAFQS
jgi:hypothetical protein